MTIPDNIDMQAVDECAAQWVLTLSAPDATTEEHAACAAWRTQHPLHDKVFQQVAQLWGAFDHVPEMPKRRKRRAPAIIAPVLCLAAVLGVLHTYPLTYLAADYRTATGEQRRITLPDGSALVLNTFSAVDVAFSDTERTIMLAEGEVLVDVAPDAQRPLRVVTEHGSFSALGTRFVVRKDGGKSTLTVLESRVRAALPTSAAASVDLQAGQRISLDGEHAGQVSAVNPAQAAIWEQHRLVFDGVSLRDVVAELGRYRPGAMLLADRDLESLRFSGVLPTNDIDTALALITQALPVRVSMASAYVTLIAGR